MKIFWNNLKHWQKWLLGILGAGLIYSGGVGVGILPDPVQPAPYSDQEIHDIISQAETDGTIPEFDTSRIDDMTRISAGYILVAQENGVDTSQQPAQATNLYSVTRDSMQSNGVQIQDLTPEAANAIAQPIQ